MFHWIKVGCFLPVLLLFCVCPTEVQGEIVSYNASSRQLYLRCPERPIHREDVLFISLRRQHDDIALANWTIDSAPVVIYDRASLGIPHDPYLLEVVLHHVTCYDVTTYSCQMIVNVASGQAVKHVQSQAFTLEGEVSEPVLRVYPNQARYNPGDTIQLNCSASIGSVNNTIVWETRLPGGNFSLVTDGCEKRKDIIAEPKSTDAKSASCGAKSTSSVTHTLTSDDDNREWRCRLKHTNQNVVFAVAVRCSGDDQCPLPEVEAVSTTRKAPQEIPTSAKIVAKPSEAAVTSSHHTLLIVIGIVSIIAILFFALVVVLIIMLRRQSNKPPPPKIIAQVTRDFSPRDRLPPACGQSRTLPQPPYDSHYAFNDYGPPSLPSLDKDETPRKVPPTSSVYVSMSAIPSLHEDQRGYPGHADWGLTKPRHDDAQHDKRSESLYSNTEPCDTTQTTKVSNGSVGSHDSHVTMGNLKL